MTLTLNIINNYETNQKKTDNTGFQPNLGFDISSPAARH